MANLKELTVIWNLLNYTYKIWCPIYYPNCVYKRKDQLPPQCLINIKLLSFSGVTEQRKPKIIYALNTTNKKEFKKMKLLTFHFKPNDEKCFSSLECVFNFIN